MHNQVWNDEEENLPSNRYEPFNPESKRGKKQTKWLCWFFLVIHTKLRVQELMGWFNNDPVARQKFLKIGNHDWLTEYASVPKLFPKTHQAYLAQWKRVCVQWFGIQGATFEMLRRKPDEVK